MTIIGVDFHPGYQEIASVNTDTGEYQEKRLAHPQEAEEFYRSLASVGQTVRVGMEASGQALLHCRSPFYLCFEHVDNLGAYTASRPETGLLPRKPLVEVVG